MSQHASEFLNRFFDLFFSSFLTNVQVGLICGLIGLFIVLRHMVFVSAALSQVAGAGLALAFWIGAVTSPHDHLHATRIHRPDERMDESKLDKDSKKIKETLDKEFADPEHGARGTEAGARGTEAGARKGGPQEKVKAFKVIPAEKPKKEKGIHLPPALVAVLLTMLVAIGLSRRSGKVDRTTQEAVVGLCFILGSALAIIFAQKAEKGAHEIQDFLFGMAVLVPKEQQVLVPLMGVLSLLVFLVMFKDFLFVSFDPLAAQAARFPTGWTNAILFMLMALVISICTRAVGAMPVFALTVLPPTAALKIHDRIVPAAITSAAIGAVAAGVGYFATGILELPAGPCIVIAAAIPVGAAWTVSWARGIWIARRERSLSRSPRTPRT